MNKAQYQIIGNLRLEGMRNRLRRYRERMRKAQRYDIMGNLSLIERDKE